MNDQIVNDLIDEIALEGDQGRTFDQLFTFAENLTAKSLVNAKLIAPIRFDEQYKAYFWNIIRNNEQLLFLENDTVIETTNLNYTGMKQKGDRIRVKAAEESQDRNIYGSLKAAKSSLTQNHKKVINLVAKSRYQGIGQHKLGELANMDSKGVFHYLKKLDQLGLIVKESAYADSVNTRIIFLKRFAPQNNKNEDENDTGDLYRIGTFKDNLIKQLKKAEKNMMTLADVIEAMGFSTQRQVRWARVQISQLHDQGAVEKFIAYDGKAQKLSVRLVEQPGDTTANTPQSAMGGRINDSSTKYRKQVDALFRDLPADYQFYQDVVASGEKGLTRQDLVDKYPEIDPEAFTLFFESAISQPTSQAHGKYTVYITEEVEGKNRLFRYFALDGWRKFNEKLGKTVVTPEAKTDSQALDLEEPPSVDHIKKAFDCRPTYKGAAKRKRSKKLTETIAEEEEAEETPIPTPRKRKAKNPKNVDAAHSNNDDKPEKPASPTVNRRVTRSHQQEDSNLEPLQPAQLANDIPPASNKRKLDEIHDTQNATSEDRSNTATSESVENKTATTKKSKRRKKLQLNSTKMRRHAILLDMMEKQHVRELNETTLTEFNELEMAAEGGQKMAMATLSRMAKQLHEEQKLRVFISTVKQASGLTEIKTLLLHASLNEDGDEVKQFIDIYKLEKPIMSGRNRRQEYKKLDVEKLPSVQTPGEESTEKDIDRLLENEKSMTYAVEYGWIKSKWLRAKEVHEKIFQYYLRTNNQDPIIDMTDFVKHLSLDTLAKICASLPYNNVDLREFMDIEANRSISLVDLPENIRLVVFEAKNRIRYIINLVLSILQALDLIEAIHDMESESKYGIAPRYRLKKEGLIRDYAFKHRTIVKTIALEDIQDVQRFWEDLRSTCLLPQRYSAKQGQIELDNSIDKNDPLHNIDKSRTWLVNVLLTSRQKEILDSFIDAISKTITFDSPALRSHLAKETNLTTSRIGAYYEGVFGAMHKNELREKKKKARLQKQLAMSADSTINDLMLASKEKRKIDLELSKMKQDDPFVEPTYVGSRRFRRLRVVVEPYQDQNQTEHGFGKKVRHNFDPLEKDLLLYSYCIMRSRAEGKKFYWSPITKIMTNRGPKSCRRVLNVMIRSDAGVLVTIERLKRKWEMYYKEGIERQEIQDERPWDTLDFDLCSYLEYFIIRMKEEEEVNASPQWLLPNKYEVFQKKFSIIRDEGRIMKLKDSENNQGTSTSVYNEYMYDTPTAITEQGAKDRSIQLVKILIKMMLITPDNLYHSEMAYGVMRNYPDKIVEKALKELKAEGFIIKNKSGYGRIPGRAFNVSEKFLTIASGILPFGLIDNARSHYATIAENEDIDLKILAINSGAVAATLDLLSQGKISLYMKYKDRYFKSKESLSYPKASAVSLRKAYVYRDLDISIKKINSLSMENCPNISHDHVGKLTIPTTEQIKKHLHHLSNTNNLVQEVYEIVRRFEGTGATMNTIILLVNDLEKRSLNESHISDAISLLVKHEPPLIQQFGFKQLRYVAAEFSSEWLLTENEDKTFLNPLMWNDVSGRVIQSALDGCAKAVMSHILKQPGISHANLRKKFEGFFTEYELHNLLIYLDEAKRIISRKMKRGSRPARASIFNKKPLLSSSTNAKLISCNEITYYWLSRDYYLFK